MNRYIIQNKGYNNNSGLNYLNCGMNQFKMNEEKQVNINNSGKFINKEREKYLEKTMNDSYNPDESTIMTSKDKSLERDIEIKADPNLGSGNYRIDNNEKNATQIQNNVAITNFKADDELNKNIKLGSA